MARTGRPKKDNPREQLVAVRLTQKERERLAAYAKAHNKTVTQVLLDGVKEVIEDPK